MAIEESKIVRFPNGASAIAFDDMDQVMTVRANGKFGKISKNDLKNGLTITSIEIQPVAPGALVAGPTGQQRKMVVTAVGTWTYGGSPVGSNADGYMTTFWWTGSTWVNNGSVRVKGEPGDVSQAVLKTEVIIDGVAISIASYTQVDRSVNSTGQLVSAGATGRKAAYMVPFSGANLNIKGFADAGLRNFSWYNGVGDSVLNTSINSNPTNGDLLTPPAGAAFFSFNVLQLNTQPEPTLVVQKDVSIKSIENTPLKAKVLESGNSVPSAVENSNAVNLSDLKNRTYNDANSEVAGSNNLGLKSEIKDRGYYIGVNGTKSTAAGWHTFVFHGLAGKIYTFGGFTGIDALYYSFFNKSDVYVAGSVKKFNDGITSLPITITFPVDGYIVIDMGRPGDDKPNNYANFMFNEGTALLPYDEPVKRTISKINGREIIARAAATIAPPKRIAHINFWIDDGGATDTTLKSIFDTKNVKAGWALITNYEGIPLTTAQIERYLDYQSEGHTIGSHSVTHQSFQTTITLANAEIEMRESKKTLLGLGFNIDFWITPQSTMRADLIDTLRKYYKYGFTTYFGSPTPTKLNGYDTYFMESRTLQRVSLEGADSTIENLKLQVDEAIAKGGLLTFYGHTPTAIGTAKLAELLDYINLKKADLQCVVDSPEKVMESYFEVDNQLVSNMWNALKV